MVDTISLDLLAARKGVNMKIAFLFAGQGAQAVGMGKDFYDNYNLAKVIYDNDGFVHDYGYDLRIPNVNLNGFKVYNSSNDFYVFNIGESPNKANGNLEYIKNNYIRPNSFNFYYPSNDAIHVNNVRKCSNGDSGCSSINTHNYVKEFNQSSVSQVQSQIGLSLNKMLHFILDLFR